MNLGYCATHLSLLFKLNNVFSLALFLPGIHNERKKRVNKRFFKNKIYLFSWQEHLKCFLENYRFCRKSGNEAIVGDAVGVMLFASLWRIAYKNRYKIPLSNTTDKCDIYWHLLCKITKYGKGLYGKASGSLLQNCFSHPFIRHLILICKT